MRMAKINQKQMIRDYVEYFGDTLFNHMDIVAATGVTYKNVIVYIWEMKRKGKVICVKGKGSKKAPLFLKSKEV